jgi:hypothetical protein
LLQAPSGTQLWKAAKFRKRKRDRGKIQIRENGSGELEPRYAHKHARYDIAEAQGLGFFWGERSTTPPACTAFTKKLKKPDLVGSKGCSCNGSSLEMHIGSPSRSAPSNVVERKACPAAPRSDRWAAGLLQIYVTSTPRHTQCCPSQLRGNDLRSYHGKNNSEFQGLLSPYFGTRTQR